MRWLFLLVASIMTFSTLHGFEMQEITTFDPLVPLFEEVGPETLVVFDVDNVLTIPNHPAFQIPNWMKHRELIRHYYGGLTENEKEALSNLMVTQNALQLIELSVPDLISNLSSRGVPVIALTGLWSGGDLSRQRWGMLHSLGIEFKGKESWGEMALFDQFPCYNSSYPLYFKGILFTNGQAVGRESCLNFSSICTATIQSGSVLSMTRRATSRVSAR